MALLAIKSQLAPPGQAVQTVPDHLAAAAPDTKGADPSWLLGAWVFVAVGAALGYGLFEWRDPKIFVPGADISLFAPLYILAQGIERLLEPFTSVFGKTDGSTKNDAANERDAQLAQGNLPEAAAAQALVSRIRRNRAVITWGLASFLAMVACGAFGIRLLAYARFDVPPFWDIVITGLAIGAGTKPLHDLIGNIQKAKENREDPPAVQTTR